MGARDRQGYSLPRLCIEKVLGETRNSPSKGTRP